MEISLILSSFRIIFKCCLLHTTNLQQTTLKTYWSKLLNKVEIIVAKGEIASFEQLLLLSKCFQKSSAAEGSESAYMLEHVNTVLG